MKPIRMPWVPLAGGLMFLAILSWAYAGIDPSLYRYRDDGVITLSHARNWVEFGFIGINPSGERVEAFSAPLQFLVYALAYLVGQVDYRAYMTAQTLACTFGIGWLFASLLQARPLFALAATAAAAGVLTQMSSFMIWHGSGMENALTHVFLLWTVVVLHRFVRQRTVDLRWLVVPFLASITRIDGIVHVAPLVAVFLVAWHMRVGTREGARFAAWLALAWVAFNALRFFYFGALLPNTAVAQGISVGERLIELATANPIYLDQSFGLARGVFTRHGGYVLLLLLPLVLFRRPDDDTLLLLLLAGTLVLTALATPFAFGPARLDVTRTTTPLALFAVLAVAAGLAGARWTRVDLYAVPAMVIVVFLVHEYARTGPYMACCNAEDFDQTRQVFARIARDEAIVRPTVANPDLGVVSWHKQFNVVDLGLLGSAIVARLHDDAGFQRYFLELAAPDAVESHGYWTCKYAAVFTDPRFAAAYVPLDGDGPRSTRACNGVQAPVPTGIWVRRDVMKASGSRERAFMDALAREPTVESVARELAACKAAGGDTACAYVMRAVYRLLPEFRAKGSAAALEPLFAATPIAAWSVSLLRGAGDARAWQPAIEQLRDR